MSFDARSRERLEALGRTLPQKLPPPAPRQPSAPDPTAMTRPRHRVESEQDPDALFHALMEASPDGSVPPHLLERLRGLEQTGPIPSAASGPSTSQAAEGSSSGASPTPPRRRRGLTAGDNRPRRAAGSDRDLYDAFDDLLRGEDDGAQDPPPPSRLPPDPRLIPRPTLRTPRSF